MSSRALWLALLVALPLAAASGFSPPEDAPRTQIAGMTFSHWHGPDVVDGRYNASASVEPNATSTLWFSMPNAGGGVRVAYVNVTSSALDLREPNLTLRADGRTSLVATFDSTAFTAPAEEGNASYTFTVEVYDEADDGNVTLVGSGSGEGVVLVQAAEAPIPPSATRIPRTWLIAGIALLVLGGGAAAYAARQRSIRRRMKGAPRSQVMREMELEQKLERAKTKDPEQAVVIQKEIRQAEQVREKRRELQILEAKRADALKTLDLLKKRHESGGLTKLQYDNMAAKKQADLARIEAEIAEMEPGGPGGAAG